MNAGSPVTFTEIYGTLNLWPAWTLWDTLGLCGTLAGSCWAGGKGDLRPLLDYIAQQELW